MSKIPDEYLINILNEGLDYEIMISDISELETATKRDSKANQQALRVRLESKIYWFHLFEEEVKSIKYAKLFKGIRTNDEYGLFEKWEDYLSDNLEFPIMTKVVEYMRKEKIKEFKLLSLDDYDDHYGILGLGKAGKETITLPLCDLEAVDKSSKNYELLKDYAVFFANK